MKKILSTLSIIAIAILAFSCTDRNITHNTIPNKPTINNPSSTPETETNIEFCKVGDILTIGESCKDKGTDATFTVLETRNGSYTSQSGLVFESTDILDARGSTLNNQSYNFKASRLGTSNNWKIEVITSD